MSRLTDVEGWLTQHAIRVLVFVLIAGAMLSGLLVYLLLDEQVRLQGVSRAGPCRALGVKNEECRRQARLILAACADQPQECAQRYGIRVVRVGDPGAR